MRRRDLIKFFLAAASVWPAAAYAQTYPSRTITVVVPLPAGGTADILARIAADKIRTGLNAQVKEHRTDGVTSALSLWTPLVKPLAAGDLFAITAGCNKRFDTCRDKFANTINFRGFPHMPGNDHVLGYVVNADSSYDGGSTAR